VVRLSEPCFQSVEVLGAKMKKHYDISEKKEIISNCTNLLDHEAWNIAQRIDHLSFRGLNKLAIAIKIIAGGKEI